MSARLLEILRPFLDPATCHFPTGFELHTVERSLIFCALCYVGQSLAHILLEVPLPVIGRPADLLEPLCRPPSKHDARRENAFRSTGRCFRETELTFADKGLDFVRTHTYI